MITIDISNKADKKWNDRLIDHVEGTVYQTKEYGYAKSLTGNEPKFIHFLNEKGNIEGQLLLFYINRFDKKNHFKFLNKLPKMKKQIIRWMYGPVIFNQDRILEIKNSFKKFLIEQNGKIYGKDFPLTNTLFNFGKPFVIKKTGTFILNLNESIQTLWLKMDKNSVRKNIKRSENRGVTIKEMRKLDYPTYLKLAFQDGKQNPFLDESGPEKWWDILQSIGYKGFLAYQDEQPIGGILAATFNGYVNEFGIVRTPTDREKNLYSQDLLKWNLINWAVKNNCKFYDFSGVVINSSNPKEQGIFKYKKKWGGKLIKFSLITN